MPAPDSTQEEVRASVLKYIRMYEEGGLTLGDLAAELSVYAPAYNEVMGAVTDHWRELLNAALEQHRQPANGFEELEEKLTDFRRAEAAW
ncbi:MAG TPA: hypothetical protein VN577_06150 [Terriglobales bacterium]|nr:hypothetical protein [Terriglobales bacterium]